MADIPGDVIALGPQSGLQYTRLTEGMADAMEELELLSFPTALPADLYDAAEYRAVAREFPEGSYVGFDGDDRAVPAAAGLGLRTTFDLDNPQHNLKTFFDDAPTECGDDPDGDWYYGTDIVVRSTYRRRGIGKELYDLRKTVCVDLNLRGIIVGGVIPGYADHKHHLTADEYIAEVREGRLYDPTLTFQLANGFESPCALENYIADPAVDSWASLIVWHNPQFRSEAGS